MSYILDALRKSEQERRQSESLVLTQAAHPVELPRRRVAPWATAAIAAVVIGVGAYWMLFQRDNRAPPTAIATAAPNGNAASALAVPAPAANVNAPVGATDAQPQNESMTAPPPVMAPTPTQSAPAPESMRTTGNVAPPAPELKPYPLAPPPDVAGARDLATEAQITPRKSKRARRAAAAEAAATSSGTSNAIGDESVKFLRLMSPDFQRSLPELVVNIHIYAPREADRILYINNRQYHAGDAVGSGVVVEQIVEDGAILSFHGQRFKLPRPS